VTLGCERSGKYKEYKKELTRLGMSTTKCDCPFKLRGRPHAKEQGKWLLHVVCGHHNHERAKVLVGHPYPARLNPDEKQVVANLTKNLVKQSNILLALKDHDPGNLSTLKTVYNERYKYRRSIRGDRTEMQHLIKVLDEQKYIHFENVMKRQMFRLDCIAHSTLW
jgi:alpha-glucosidase